MQLPSTGHGVAPVSPFLSRSRVVACQVKDGLDSCFRRNDDSATPRPPAAAAPPRDALQPAGRDWIPASAGMTVPLSHRRGTPSSPPGQPGFLLPQE